MIKIKNRRLDTETIDVINEIIDMKISPTAAFKLMKIVKVLHKIVNDRKEMEMILVNEFAVKNEDGSIKVPKDNNGNNIEGTFEIIDENSKEFNSKINDIIEFENELEFDPIKFEELELEDKITVKKLIKIDFLFC